MLNIWGINVQSIDDVLPLLETELAKDMIAVMNLQFCRNIEKCQEL